MKLVIHGKNIEITDAIREYVEQKIEKAVSHFEQFTLEVDVHLGVAKNPRIDAQTAEVTIFANGMVIRAEESRDDLYASIDVVADKISRRLRKYKEKRFGKKKHAQNDFAQEVRELEEPPIVVADLIGDRTPELPKEVVRTKYFAMPAMTVDEALEQLQLIDHDFYMFRNAATGEINVIYERKSHGGYGLILPRNGHGNSTNGKKASVASPVKSRSGK